jgi:hypothetical protein
VQNSLDRLFEGMAEALREVVAPVVADPYAKAQVLATVEVLGNLATRVEWRCADLREEIERVDALLGGASDVPADNEGLVRARAERLAALAARQAEGSLDETQLHAFLDWQLERELGRLRTGMYGTRKKA